MKQLLAASVIMLPLIFQFHPSHSQVPDLEWSRCYGGTLSDWGEYMFPLQDSSFLVTGSSRSDDFDVSGHHANGYYVGYDYWVARIKWDGTLLWQNSFGGTQTDLGRGIVQPDAAHFVISGYAISNDYDITGNHGYYDLWLMKMDTSGNLIWGKTYGGTNEDDNWDLIETADHGFLLTGATLSINGDISNPHGAYDSWVVKTDSLGNLEWQKAFGGTSDEYFNQTIQTADSNYLSVGRTFSDDGDVSQLIGDADVWVVKYDSTGTIIWEKTFGGTALEEAQAVVAVSGVGYVITGSTYSNNVNVNGNHGNSDIWVLAIDESGNLLWQHCYGGTNDETSWGISTVPGGYLVSGETFSNDGDVTTNYGGKDGWIISIDTSGNLLGQKNFGGSGEDWMRMVKTTPTGDMFSIGTSTSSDHDAINAHGDYDFFVLKFLPSCLPVAADFSLQQNVGVYVFTDNSDNATQWFWDFGDGDTSTDQNPIHQFAVSGEYTICLIAGNSCFSDTACITVKVLVTVTSSPSLTLHDAPFTVFPNPFTESATIQFSISQNSPVEISLTDLRGKKIKTIAQGNFEAGDHTLNFSAEDLPKGIYFLQIKTDFKIQSQKLVVQ